mgnify:CR=1 FL=1|tara:strand:+ start:169 stop:834 length:666 start_codon:yes stop_codon:yes gene_type:complete
MRRLLLAAAATVALSAVASALVVSRCVHALRPSRASFARRPTLASRQPQLLAASRSDGDGRRSGSSSGDGNSSGEGSSSGNGSRSGGGNSSGNDSSRASVASILATNLQNLQIRLPPRAAMLGALFGAWLMALCRGDPIAAPASLLLLQSMLILWPFYSAVRLWRDGRRRSALVLALSAACRRFCSRWWQESSHTPFCPYITTHSSYMYHPIVVLNLTTST